MLQLGVASRSTDNFPSIAAQCRQEFGRGDPGLPRAHEPRSSSRDSACWVAAGVATGSQTMSYKATQHRSSVLILNSKCTTSAVFEPQVNRAPASALSDTHRPGRAVGVGWLPAVRRG